MTQKGHFTASDLVRYKLLRLMNKAKYKGKLLLISVIASILCYATPHLGGFFENSENLQKLAAVVYGSV